MHGWKNLVEFFEVIFHYVVLVVAVEAIHLGLSHIEAVCIVWVDDFSPDFGFDVRVWKCCHALSATSLSDVRLVVSKNHIYHFHLSVVFKVS